MAVSLFACKWYASGTRVHLDLQLSFANQSLEFRRLFREPQVVCQRRGQEGYDGAAMQVFAGCSFIVDYPVELMMRNAKLTQIFERTNQIQRVVIARELLRSGFQCRGNRRNANSKA
jgi:short subunit dehydrogenase-like uncharacterized protein